MASKSQETLKLHARYTERLSRLIDGFGDNLSAARVARYSIELLLSEEEEYRTGHYEGVWKRRFWFESFKSLKRSTWCTAFNFFFRFVHVFLNYGHKGKYAANLLSNRYKKILVKDFSTLFLHQDKTLIGTDQLFLLRRLSATNTLIVSVILISALLIWWTGVKKKRQGNKKYINDIQKCWFKFANYLVTNEIVFLRKIIRGSSIKVIINSGDSSISGSILALASRMENICYVSVNHGVVSDALGRSILPSYASHQACWSRAQAIELGQFNKNKIDIEKQHNIVFFDIGVPTSTFKG